MIIPEEPQIGRLPWGLRRVVTVCDDLSLHATCNVPFVREQECRRKQMRVNQCQQLLLGWVIKYLGNRRM
jgi:hypothetical protein